MGNLDYSRLSKDLTPYLAPMIRKALDAALAQATLPKSSGGSGGSPPAPPAPYILEPHVLATDTGLGSKHTVSGLTAGQTIVATGPTAARFAVLQHNQVGGVGANDHHNQSHALDGADHTGALSWGKVSKSGASLADLPTRLYADLQTRTHDIIGGDHSYTGGAALDVFGLSAASTLARITPSDSVSSAQTAILKATNGALSIDVLTATAKVRSPLYDTGSGSITLSPAGTAVLPTGSILKDMGDYNRKWRTLYAAELYVETLVAQDVLATIGGRIMVAPTTTLIADAASSDTTIDVKHNNITGAYVYLSSAPGGVAQVEVMKCGATATPITGGYRYTVTRNQDGTGANDWVAGDAIAGIGAAAGQGWIDLTSTNTVYNHLGPTMTIYSRTGMAAWTDAKPVVSVGNLRSWVDYGADEFGFALGNDLALTKTTGFSGMTGDCTNGLRLFNSPVEMYNGATLVGKWWSNGQLDIGFDGITALADRDFTVHASGFVRIGREGTNKPNLRYTAGGDLQLRSNTTPVITLASDGSSYFSGPMSLGTSGGIYQGTGTFGSPTTGLKIWRDSGVGRIAGYTSGVLQWSGDTQGKLKAGTGFLSIDATGLHIDAQPQTGSALPWGNQAIRWDDSGGRPVALATGYIASPGDRRGVAIGVTNTTLDIMSWGMQVEEDDITLYGDVRISALSPATGALLVDGGATFTSGATLGAPLDTFSGVTLELKQDTTSILRSLKGTNDAYLKLGNGRTADGLAYLDLIGDTTNTTYGLRFLRNSGVNGVSYIRHLGTGALQIQTNNAADMQLRTNNTTRLTLQSDGLTKIENSIAVNGDYGGTAGYTTFTDATSAAGGSGGGTVKMNGTTGRNNSGFVKAYVGTQEVFIPYWNTVSG